ncbi:hypothetical protein DTO021C3_6074 [Paecilomyces variotii]|nr:hypothetical protein DTO169C6_787 [Paecilomyces variotii]KAJ9286364.1 hypothetical protein DTO021C3_6074 [Paecilomyces variotii]
MSAAGKRRTISDQCYRQVRSGFKVVIIETRVPGIATDPSPHPLAPGGSVVKGKKKEGKNPPLLRYHPLAP